MNRISRQMAAASRRACVAGVTVLIAALASGLGAGPAFALEDPPSTRAGVRLPVEDVLRLSYDAGFRSETSLLTATSIAIAESSLWTQTRNWHPEFGFRPGLDAIGVQGPEAAWNSSHTRQLHSDRGLWQISSRWWPDYTDAQADDPATAAGIVFELSNGGTDFRRWDTFASGSAQRAWDDAYDGWPALRPLVQRFLAGQGGSPPVGHGTHAVRDGDTLFRLAVRYYGDGDLWTRIADANGIDRHAEIHVGETLIIP